MKTRREARIECSMKIAGIFPVLKAQERLSAREVKDDARGDGLPALAGGWTMDVLEDDIAKSAQELRRHRDGMERRP